jgi:hypothetical protein
MSCMILQQLQAQLLDQNCHDCVPWRNMRQPESLDFRKQLRKEELYDVEDVLGRDVRNVFPTKAWQCALE